jgi:hypothetical protein
VRLLDLMWVESLMLLAIESNRNILRAFFPPPPRALSGTPRGDESAGDGHTGDVTVRPWLEVCVRVRRTGIVLRPSLQEVLSVLQELMNVSAREIAEVPRILWQERLRPYTTTFARATDRAVLDEIGSIVSALLESQDYL